MQEKAVARGNYGEFAAELPALRLVQSSTWIRWLGYVLLGMLLISSLLMLLLPWQQSARGSGRVIAFVPQERQQPVMAPVKGVVSMIAPDLREGDFVKQGAVILELQPAAANMVEQMNFQLADLRAKLESAKIKAEVYQRNIKDFTDARDYGVRAAEEMVEMAQAKLQAKQTLLPGYEAKELQARLNYERQRSLFDKGATAEKELEKLKKDLDVAISDLASAKFEVQSALKEVDAKQHELEQKRSEAQTKIDYAKAMEQDALGLQATVQKEIRDIDIKLSELKLLRITAPRDGTIYRLPLYERGQTIKEGETLFTIVGTFGGQVAKVDPTDDGTGKFRIQVTPEKDTEWPPTQNLRQGVRANGWVMLKTVSLGYEIWRQINGFPPVIEDPNREKPTKVPLPK